MNVLNLIYAALGRKKSDARCGIRVGFKGENGDLCIVCREFSERRVGGTWRRLESRFVARGRCQGLLLNCCE